MTDKIIWAKWRLHEDGRVEVVATLGEPGSYFQRGTFYGSLDDAVEVLGSGFRDVVDRSVEAGSKAGHWRP